MKLNTLYSRATNGKINEYVIEIEDNKYRTISGYTDGIKTTSEWKVCAAKSYCTAEEQAMKEATTMHRKKMETGSFENMTTLAKMSKSFGAFYNDARQLDLAFSESLLEGAGAKAQHIQNSLDAYYAKHGELPTGEEAQKIADSGDSIKFNTVMSNAALIYTTNKFVFEDMFDRVRAKGRMAASFLEGDKRALTKTAAKEFKVGQTQAYKAAEEAAKWSVKGSLKKIATSPYNPVSLKYLSKNISEAFQEAGQESITAGMLDYERRKLEDPTYASSYNWLSGIAHGMGEQLSLEGLNVFAQGYLTGGILGPLQGGIIKTGIYHIFFKSFNIIP